MPDYLIMLSTIMALFCIGLAWRYYVGALDNGLDILGSWLPIVLLILALCIIVGIVEAWRGPTPSKAPIQDPYYLLETTAPLAEPPKNKSFIADPTLAKKFALRIGALAVSILIGFSGAALLISWSGGDAGTSFFASNRVRPTPQPVEHATALLTLDDEPKRLTGASSMTGIQPATSEIGVPIDKMGLASARTAIGGPIQDTPLEAITNLPMLDGTNSFGEVDFRYNVMIQATLGVKARRQPTTEGQVLDVLQFGRQYRAVGRTTNGEWILIQLDENQSVWIIAFATGGFLVDEQQNIIPIEQLPIAVY